MGVHPSSAPLDSSSESEQSSDGTLTMILLATVAGLILLGVGAAGYYLWADDQVDTMPVPIVEAEMELDFRHHSQEEDPSVTPAPAPDSTPVFP